LRAAAPPLAGSAPITSITERHARARFCERATDLQLEVSNVVGEVDRGSAHWEATYTFSGTGRRVHNVIEASFLFEGERFLHHTDAFDLYAWARQALGPKGVLLGWSPPVQRAIRSQAARGLEAFIRRQGLGATA
jgi:hypothetical protein